MFEILINKAKLLLTTTGRTNERFYADVMDELTNGFKDKALVGKTIVQSNGNISKSDSIYIELRAKKLQEIHQTQNKIEKNNLIKQQHTFSIIRKKYENGYFHELFSDDIKDKGFTTPWYAHESRLFKNDIEYYTKLDTEEMKFLIINSQGDIIQHFNLP